MTRVTDETSEPVEVSEQGKATGQRPSASANSQQSSGSLSSGKKTSGRPSTSEKTPGSKSTQPLAGAMFDDLDLDHLTHSDAVGVPEPKRGDSGTSQATARPAKPERPAGAGGATRAGASGPTGDSPAKPGDQSVKSDSTHRPVNPSQQTESGKTSRQSLELAGGLAAPIPPPFQEPEPSYPPMFAAPEPMDVEPEPELLGDPSNQDELELVEPDVLQIDGSEDFFAAPPGEVADTGIVFTERASSMFDLPAHDGTMDSTVQFDESTLTGGQTEPEVRIICKICGSLTYFPKAESYVCPDCYSRIDGRGSPVRKAKPKQEGPVSVKEGGDEIDDLISTALEDDVDSVWGNERSTELLASEEDPEALAQDLISLPGAQSSSDSESKVHDSHHDSHMELTLAPLDESATASEASSEPASGGALPGKEKFRWKEVPDLTDPAGKEDLGTDGTEDEPLLDAGDLLELTEESETIVSSPQGIPVDLKSTSGSMKENQQAEDDGYQLQPLDAGTAGAIVHDLMGLPETDEPSMESSIDRAPVSGTSVRETTDELETPATTGNPYDLFADGGEAPRIQPETYQSRMAGPVLPTPSDTDSDDNVMATAPVVPPPFPGGVKTPVQEAKRHSEPVPQDSDADDEEVGDGWFGNWLPVATSTWIWLIVFLDSGVLGLLLLAGYYSMDASLGTTWRVLGSLVTLFLLFPVLALTAWLMGTVIDGKEDTNPMTRFDVGRYVVHFSRLCLLFALGMPGMVVGAIAGQAALGGLVSMFYASPVALFWITQCEYLKQPWVLADKGFFQLVTEHRDTMVSGVAVIGMAAMLVLVFLIVAWLVPVPGLFLLAPAMVFFSLVFAIQVRRLTFTFRLLYRLDHH